MSTFAAECLDATMSRAHGQRGGSPALPRRMGLRWSARGPAFATPAPAQTTAANPVPATNGEGVEKSRGSGLNPAARPFFIGKPPTITTAAGLFIDPFPATAEVVGAPYGAPPPSKEAPSPAQPPNGAYFGLSGASLDELNDLRRVRGMPYRARMLPRPLPFELHATIWAQNASADGAPADFGHANANGDRPSPPNREGGGEHGVDGPDAASDGPRPPSAASLERLDLGETQRRLSAYRAIMERWYRHLQALLEKSELARNVIVQGPCPKLDDFRSLRLAPEKYELTVDEEENALREWSDSCLWWWGEIKLLSEKITPAANVAAHANVQFQTANWNPDQSTGDEGGDRFVVTSSDNVEPLWFNQPPPYLTGAGLCSGDGDLLLIEALRESQQGQLMLDEDKLTEACGRQLLMEIAEDEE